MRLLIFVCMVVVSVVPVRAADVTVTFSEGQLNALVQLMDLGVKAGGLQVVSNAAVLIQLLEQAKTKAEATTTESEKK